MVLTGVNGNPPLAHPEPRWKLKLRLKRRAETADSHVGGERHVADSLRADSFLLWLTAPVHGYQHRAGRGGGGGGGGRGGERERRGSRRRRLLHRGGE